MPDQTALMFWAIRTSHDLANKALAVRIYQNLHGEAYDMTRSHTPEVPECVSAASGSLLAEQPYFVLDQPADWMLGRTHHLVGVRRPDLPAAEFLHQALEVALAVRARPPVGVDGVLVVCGEDYAAAWAHAPRDDVDPAEALSGLAALLVPALDLEVVPLELRSGLWDDWSGLDLSTQSCLNIQLDRPSGDPATGSVGS